MSAKILANSSLSPCLGGLAGRSGEDAEFGRNRCHGDGVLHNRACGRCWILGGDEGASAWNLASNAAVHVGVECHIHLEQHPHVATFASGRTRVSRGDRLPGYRGPESSPERGVVRSVGDCGRSRRVPGLSVSVERSRSLRRSKATSRIAATSITLHAIIPVFGIGELSVLTVRRIEPVCQYRSDACRS